MGAVFGRRLRVSVAAVALALVGPAWAGPAGASAAPPPEFWTHCESAAAAEYGLAGHCYSPRGVAVAPAGATDAGDAFLADQLNHRVDEFTAWGQFVKAWGYDVVESGPDNTGTGFEVCNVAIHPEDVCKAGRNPEDVSEGGSRGKNGAGGFNNPVGIAVDSAGDVYVYDIAAFRLQKFDPSAGPEETAKFVWAIGRNVNKTKESGGTQAEKDICTAASHDECQGGESGTGPGEFANEKLGDYVAVDTSKAVYPEDALYVGDEGRIQRFDADGEYKGQIATPKTVQSLDVDASGHLYAAYLSGSANEDEPNVRKLDPTKASATELCSFAVANPRAVAVAPRGGEVFAFDKASTKILRFGAECGAEAKPVESFGEGLGGGFVGSTGLAATASCRSAGNAIYLASTTGATPPETHFLRAYGLPPDEADCPPPKKAPAIDSQYALSVGSGEAELQAEIDPHYWSGSIGTTEYYVRYATAVCIEEGGGWGASCVKQRPATPAALEAGVVEEDIPTAAISLAGLAPGTRYLYRFAAESLNAEGEPVVEEQPVEGVGGTPGEAGEEAAFTTFAEPEGPNESCPNQALRAGPSALLPDCRAYELVSPPEKYGGDVGTLGVRGLDLDQASPGGAGLTYSANQAFGDAEGAPKASQYLTARTERGQPGEGWRSTSLNPPQEGTFVPPYTLLTISGTPYRAFSPSLEEGWLLTYTEPVLAPGAPAGEANLYRRDLVSGQYEACTTAAQEEQGAYSVLPVGPKPLGASADGRHGFFRVAARMTPTAAVHGIENGTDQVYECSYASGGPRSLDLVSVLPDGAASALSNTVGTANLEWARDLGRTGSYRRAIAADGSRAYWTATPYQRGENFGEGTLYLRLNPAAPESEHLHGAAAGTGDLIGPAKGEAVSLRTSGAGLHGVIVKEGGFAVGQEVSDSLGKLEAGAKVSAIEFEATEVVEGKELCRKKVVEGKLVCPYNLTVSPPPKAVAGADTITGAHSAVASATLEHGAFQAGQALSGPGLAPGARIEAVAETSPGRFALTLSAPAEATRSPGAAIADETAAAAGARAEAAPLEATSPCTEAATKACTVPVSTGKAQFWDATSGGDEALFSEGDDIYAFEVALHEGTPVTEVRRIAGQFTGVVGASEGLGRVYLVSREDCDGGGKGEEGAYNLYLAEAGASCAAGQFAFVAALSAADASPGGISVAQPQPEFHTALASADGGTLAFLARSPALAREAAGYDNIDQASGEADMELYRYEAATGALACLSCNPGGARPTGRRVIQGGEASWQAASLPAWETSLYAVRSLSENGRRVFFESYEPLVLADTDGTADVYEWEAAGEVSCRKGTAAYVAASGGCLFLISSGKSSTDSIFVDASADGADVFFITAQSLVGADPGSLDIYDARVDGGFPEASPAPACEGEACQSPPPAPAGSTPASAAFRGPGNLSEGSGAASRCPKGKVKRKQHGKARCVALHNKAHRKHRANRSRKAH